MFIGNHKEANISTISMRLFLCKMQSQSHEVLNFQSLHLKSMKLLLYLATVLHETSTGI